MLCLGLRAGGCWVEKKRDNRHAKTKWRCNFFFLIKSWFIFPPNQMSFAAFSEKTRGTNSVLLTTNVRLYIFCASITDFAH
jgi:hypothetical protein